MKKDGRIRVGVLALGHLSADTGGRTYLGEVLGPLGDEPDLDVEVHVADPDFDVPSSCRAVRHRVPPALGASGRVLAEALVARGLASGRRGVLLAPLNFLPATWRGPSVAVQHNVLSFGHTVTRTRDLARLRGWYRPRALAMTLRRATEIAAVSAYLRELLLDRFRDLDPNRVHVIPHGVPRRWKDLAPASQTASASPTVLVVSALWRYKRVDHAIEAFAQATRDLPAARLEIAGPGGEGERAALEDLARRLEVTDRVVFLGSLDYDELARRYVSADALLYLSEVESFGLPVLEAMALGVPVVARRVGGVVEVGGNVPFWVSPEAGPADAAAQLQRALLDADARYAHVSAGRARAEAFTWDRTATLTADALRAAVDGWQSSAVDFSARHGSVPANRR